MRERLPAVIEVLRREIPGLAGLYLFGSHATGHTGRDSDVDLAFYAPCALTSEQRLDLALRLGSVFSRDVDLIDLGAVSTVLQMQVLRDGELLFVADKRALGLFELRVLRDYHELKFRRAPIERDIVQRGRVHA